MVCDPIFSSSIVRREFNDSGIAGCNDAVGIAAEGKGLCGGPDGPDHHRTDHDRASLLTGYTRKSSVGSSAGGSLFERSLRDASLKSPCSSSVCSDSDSNNGDIHSLCSDDDCEEVVRQILQHDQPVQITIKLHVTEDQYTKWQTIFNPNNNILYVAFPAVLPPAGSKQTFVSLLEFAEDKLEVDGIVMCMNKNHPERERLIETFLIMGFEPLSRKSDKAPPAAINDNENYYFLYTIEEE